MKGVILAGGSGSRLSPLTNLVNKQLLPVYDKPMIYYPLSTLIHAGCKHILVISTPRDTPRIEEVLQSGSQFGLQIEYLVQEQPEGIAQGVYLATEFTEGDEFWFILGDNFFHGPSFGANLQALALEKRGRAVAFAYRVMDARHYGTVEFNGQSNAIIRFVEKPSVSAPGWAVPGLYKFDERAKEFSSQLNKSSRGEFEILDLLDRYRKENSLHLERVSRGNAWFDLGTPDNLLNGANFVSVVQNRQGQLIGSPEESALRSGILRHDIFEDALKSAPQSDYFNFLRTFST